MRKAAWLDGEWLLVLNPDGKAHRHQKIDGALVELERWHCPGMELAGHLRNFEISGESDVKKSSFSFQDLEWEQAEPLFDWPEGG